MTKAAMQGPDQQIRSSMGFSLLPKDTSTFQHPTKTLCSQNAGLFVVFRVSNVEWEAET